MAREGILRRTETVLEFGSIATTAAGATASGDTEIDIRNAKYITVQVDQEATTYNGADTDINVLTRTETGSTYDTEPFAEQNFGSAMVKSFVVTPGAAYMKLTADNNDTTNKCSPIVTVQVMG